jgi:hypothetical protein
MPVGAILGAAAGPILGQVLGSIGKRDERRFRERQSALDSINQYRQFIARMLAEDPAKFLKMLGQGKRAGERVTGKGWTRKPSAERAAYLEQLGRPETYNLAERPGGGYAFRAPAFSPAVSEKYAPHLGGFKADNLTHRFGGSSAGFGLPESGFTDRWKLGAT